METVGNVMLEEVHQLRWCTNVFANSEMGGAPCSEMCFRMKGQKLSVFS